MIKLHGTGNTFYLLDGYQGDYKTKAIDLCQDGTDGVMFVESSEKFLCKMRIFNADGSEPEMCGNGLRCFARYVLEKYQLVSAEIETLKTAYRVYYIENFYGMVGIEIDLYPVKSLAHEDLEDFIHVSKESAAFYTVSNPHVVIEKPDRVREDYLEKVGQEGNRSFSDGVNVNILSVLSPGKIYVQTFERGVGITKSCGTGMTSASLHYAMTYDYFDQAIEVYNDGGMISCRVIKMDKDYMVKFTGNATYIQSWDDGESRIYTEDQAKYEKFLMWTRNNLRA